MSPCLLYVIFYVSVLCHPQEHIDSLLDAVKTKDEGLAHHWTKTEEWATVEQLIAANGNLATGVERWHSC